MNKNSQTSNARPNTMEIVNRGLARRYRTERNFRLLGVGAIFLSLLFLAILFINIIGNGYSAFVQTYMKLDIFLDPEMLSQDNLESADFPGLVKKTMREMFPDVRGRREKRKLYSLVSTGAAFQLREMVLGDPDIVGKTVQIWVPADDEVDMLIKGHVDVNLPESDRRLTDKQLTWINAMDEQGRIEKRFNRTLFTAGDSTYTLNCC